MAPGNAGRDAAGSQNRKIFIGGLNYNSTEESLKNHFSKYGELVDVVVMKFPDTKRSRGFGFVTYSKDEEVDACQIARPHIVDGKTVETKRATPREEFGKPEAGQTVKKVFVGGIKEDVEDEDLKNYFSEFGNVTAVTRLTHKESGKKRGFAFVEFDDYDPVDKAILKGQHKVNGNRVDVKKAISKQEMNSMCKGRNMGGPRSMGGRGDWNNMGGGGPGRNHFHGGSGQGWGNQWGNNSGGPGGWNSGNSYGNFDNSSGWSSGMNGAGVGGNGWSASGGSHQGAGGYGGGPAGPPVNYGAAGDWGGNGGFGGGPSGYNQSGYGGGPMRGVGLSGRGGGMGGYRTAPYSAPGTDHGSPGGFRGGRGGGFGRRM